MAEERNRQSRKVQDNCKACRKKENNCSQSAGQNRTESKEER